MIFFCYIIRIKMSFVVRDTTVSYSRLRPLEVEPIFKANKLFNILIDYDISTLRNNSIMVTIGFTSL